MKNTSKKISEPTTNSVTLFELRRAFLQMDRIETRKKAQRKLEKIANMNDPVLSPFALEGLASSFFWSGDINAATYWCKQTMSSYPMTAAALGCSTLLVSIYRMLGMKKERFEAEGDRMRIMKRIALQSNCLQDKIFALNQLKSELEQRDLHLEAERCQEELQDLVN